MKNIFYIITAGCLWGIISVFVNLLKELGFDSMQCVAIRAFFAMVFLMVYLLVTDKSKLKIKVKDLVYFIGTGIGSIVFFNYCYFQSIEIIGGAAVPALLLYTAPVFVMVLSAFFFKEKITKKKIAALLLTLVGLGFVTGAFSGGERLSPAVLLLGLGSGLGYALYSIFSKFVIEKYDAVTITFYTFLIAALGAIPLSGIVSRVSPLFSTKGIVATIGLAFLCTVLPFLLYTNGLKSVEAGKASILATVEPLVAAVVGAVFYRETFTVQKVTGIFLVLLAVLILNLQHKQMEKSDKK